VRRRLDVEMVRRGLSASRSEAALAIRSGKVVVSGSPAVKASTMVLPGESISVTAAARRFVSRGGEKLEAALDRFGVEVEGRYAMDAGASTGGFTDCMLSRGAAHVVTVDVGYGQLDWRLREDPRVTVRERTNVRDLDPESLPYAPELVTADLSFISLRVAIPALVRCAGDRAILVLLVKPQFEAGKKEVGDGGVVRDPEVWRRVLSDVVEACRAQGLEVEGAMASPLLGPAGNAEFFLHAHNTRAVLGEQAPPPVGKAGSDLDAAVEEALEIVEESARRGREAGARG
jgi:23S rRNA (cytidine1920-2'-O)/16S rRNA (cytidine1409-2'-O)-methyltransferase